MVVVIVIRSILLPDLAVVQLVNSIRVPASKVATDIRPNGSFARQRRLAGIATRY